MTQSTSIRRRPLIDAQNPWKLDWRFIHWRSRNAAFGFYSPASRFISLHFCSTDWTNSTTGKKLHVRLLTRIAQVITA